jgi:hypothetical protein
MILYRYDNPGEWPLSRRATSVFTSVVARQRIFLATPEMPPPTWNLLAIRSRGRRPLDFIIEPGTEEDLVSATRAATQRGQFSTPIDTF